MTAFVTVESLCSSINKDIEHAVARETKRILDKAKDDLDKALRAEVGKIALTLMKSYNLHRDGENIIITVQDRR